MLRIVRADEQVNHGAPHVLGVDDWAWRKAQRYGSVLVDLETNQVVDLLPDRESATLSTWLKSNPGAEIIARDRAGSYAKGAREGAPLARHVADRWHMLRNCSDALLAAVEKRYKLVREVGRSLANDVAPAGPLERPATIGMSSAALDHRRRSRTRRHMMFNAVVSLRDKGWSISAIAHETGRDRKTIRQWLLDKRPGILGPASRHPANAFEEYLRSRWDEGCRNATQLYRGCVGAAIMAKRAASVAGSRPGCATLHRGLQRQRSSAYAGNHHRRAKLSGSSPPPRNPAQGRRPVCRGGVRCLARDRGSGRPGAAVPQYPGWA
jgi:transposase